MDLTRISRPAVPPLLCLLPLVSALLTVLCALATLRVLPWAVYLAAAKISLP